MVQEEILQCFDENKNPTEGRPRSIVKEKPNKYWYGVVCIWLVNNAGQILCSKRSLSVTSNPGKWESYFGGHVSLNQTFKQTGVKELREEIGISINEEELYLIETIKKPEEKVFVERFSVFFNESTIDLSKTDGEVSEVRWMNIDDYWKEQETNPEMWCMQCRPHHQTLIREWLANKLK